MCPQAVALRAERKQSRTGRTAWKTSWTSRCGSGTKTSPTRKTSLLDAADARRCCTHPCTHAAALLAHLAPMAHGTTRRRRASPPDHPSPVQRLIPELDRVVEELVVRWK